MYGVGKSGTAKSTKSRMDSGREGGWNEWAEEGEGKCESSNQAERDVDGMTQRCLGGGRG